MYEVKYDPHKITKKILKKTQEPKIWTF